MGVWENILDLEIEESYADPVFRFKFRRVCSQFPIFVDYVESNILGPVKEKVVIAWTKRCMHLSNTTTNRVESTHARLKLYIHNSLGDICRNWECISQMLGNQLIYIHRQFEKSKIDTIKQLIGNVLFSHIQRNISRKTVNQHVAEVDWVEDMGKDKAMCGCISKTTFGLPCACELLKTVHARKLISLDVINTHWKRLSLDEVDLVKKGRSSLTLEPE